MKILVTGGAGFIGSNLCKKLLNTTSDEILCMDNLITGDISNIQELMNYHKFKFIKHDICDKFTIEVDRIYNCACPASPVHYKKHSLETLRCNTIGIMNLLDLCSITGARFLQTSTSEVYGDPEVSPQLESYWGRVNSYGPRSCYDEGKRVAEAIIYEYQRKYLVDCRIVRIFNTYGPNMMISDGRVISNFIVQALQNKSITIYGDGSYTRSFCYVDDTLDGLIKLMNNNISTPVNIGNPTELTMKEIATKIIRKTDSNSQIIYLKKVEDDPKRRCPDINKAKEELNYEPKVSLDEGLEKTIEYFKKKLNFDNKIIYNYENLS